MAAAHRYFGVGQLGMTRAWPDVAATAGTLMVQPAAIEQSCFPPLQPAILAVNIPDRLGRHGF
jgi:hypothetical protein